MTSVKVCTGIGIVFCPLSLRVVRPNSEASESSVACFKKLPNLREVIENMYLNLVEFVKLLNILKNILRLTPEDGLPFGFAQLKEEGVESGGVEDGHDDHISPHDLHRRRTRRRWRRSSGGNWNGTADTKKHKLDKLYVIKSLPAENHVVDSSRHQPTQFPRKRRTDGQRV